MSHTKGNWYVKFMHEDDPDSDFWVKSDVNPKVHYGTDIMCDDYGEHNGYPREQRLADAKLIASAPDLLEALKELLNLNPNEVDISSKINAEAKAKDAIKKATE